jgi:diguanylate cyclase (GGDEF)-like protein
MNDMLDEVIRSRRDLAHLAHHDSLTGLPNRVLFQAKSRQALADRPVNRRLAVLHVDLDDFKAVNETMGRSAGDAVLKAVAERLSTCLSGSDALARLSGDEFALLHLCDGARDATEFAARIAACLRRPMRIGAQQIETEASIGVALAPDDGVEPEDLLRNAELALGLAKSDGPGACRFFEPAMDARVQTRRRLETDLRKALAADEFELFYQPIVSLARNRVAGFEALIRWNHPERGLVSPVEFIPTAEEMGLIVPIGEWVLRRACQEASRWPADLKVAVNLSPMQFKNPRLDATVASALAESGLATRRLKLEITETALLTETEATLTMLHQIRKLGVRIGMDDFGTGYSSLAYLRRFPFDNVKIDRSFVTGLNRRDDCLAIVRAVAGLGRSLGIETTAEGVETEEELQVLRAEGCSNAQGYLFSRPKPASEIRRMIDAINGGLQRAA